MVTAAVAARSSGLRFSPTEAVAAAPDRQSSSTVGSVLSGVASRRCAHGGCDPHRPRGRCCGRRSVRRDGVDVVFLTGPVAGAAIGELPGTVTGSRCSPDLKGWWCSGAMRPGPARADCCRDPHRLRGADAARDGGPPHRGQSVAILAGRGPQGCPTPTVPAGPGLPVAILTGPVAGATGERPHLGGTCGRLRFSADTDGSSAAVAGRLAVICRGELCSLPVLTSRCCRPRPPLRPGCPPLRSSPG